MTASDNGSVVLVVDVANVMGSRPDGWWRDRAGAATRLVARLARLVGRQVDDPDDLYAAYVVTRVVAVLEGRATAAAPEPADGVEVLRAPGSGDDAIVVEAERAAGAGEVVVVVTADRGLRERLPPSCRVMGPGRLLRYLE